MNKVSLLMTVGPEQDWMDAAVWSAIRSSYPNWELIVYADGVPLENPLPDDSRVQVFHGPPSRGRAQALRQAYRLSDPEAPYMGWLDADDMLGPHALTATVELLDANPLSPLAVTGLTPARERASGYWEAEKAAVPKPWVEGGQPLNHHFALCRRRDVDAVGGFCAGREWAMDVDLLLKLEERGPVGQAPDCSHYHWRRHPKSWGERDRRKQAQNADIAIRAAILRRQNNG